MSDSSEPRGRGETWDAVGGDAWFATEHARLEWQRWQRAQRGELPEVTVMCADGGRHREKRLGAGDEHAVWPSRASKIDAEGTGIHFAGGQKTTTFDPCPTCGKHVTISRENWQKVYAFCMLTGRTKFDVTVLPF